MAGKVKASAMHTAGIFSDMTVDGPEIGTLVVVVDRAKNLPNRKTIGKQDPYCAARLGKEAKKTETDRRGGQTPKWDQELRFTVHDSADYYQLKVSVFNDDKKTDLIGETWINLQEIIIPGGGQNDLWHNLNCKGKYAGEVRIEITYYDTRPKQEKPEKIKQASVLGVEDRKDSMKGPRQLKAPVKRRPLPSDPVTGAPPPQVDDTPPRAYQPPTAIPEHVRTPQRTAQSPNYIPNQSPLQSVEYQTPPARHPQSQSFNGSPSITGYGSPADVFAPSPTAREVQGGRYGLHDPIPLDMNNSRQRNNSFQGEDSYNYNSSRNQYEDGYDDQLSPYELPQQDDFNAPPSPDGPPPPPPVHRSRHNSHHVSPAPPMPSQGNFGVSVDRRPSNAQGMSQHDMHRRSMPAFSHVNTYQSYTPPAKQDQYQQAAIEYDPSPPRASSYDSRFDGNEFEYERSPSRNGSHISRQERSGNGYDRSPSRTGSYISRRDEDGNGYDHLPGRQNSFDARQHGNYGSMQPTVEDDPDTPTSQPWGAHYDDRRYDQVPSPAPLNLSGRGSAASGRYAASTAPSSQLSNGYGSGNSPISFRDQQSTVSSQTSYNSLPQQKLPRHYSDEITGPGDRLGDYSSPETYGLPPVPPTLVAGMDPSIAKEISDRIYAEKRASQNQSGVNAQRINGRYESPQYQPNRPHPLKYQESAVPFVPAAASYDERQSRNATAIVPMTKLRAISPDPRVPARKSVSPAPETPDRRRLSGVPFGPDSYNALNPATGPSPGQKLSTKYDTKEDPDAKIITHDGREIDPSDHIPESNYAPLLETKAPKYASQQPDRNYRPSPSTRQSNPATGRTPLRQRPERPLSMAATSPIVFHSGNPHSEPSTPQNNRHRLQKKTNRTPTQPAPQSSPLGPLVPYGNNNYSPTPRSVPRANTGDFSSENYSPQQYGGSPGYRSSPGPPIPAKVPSSYQAPAQPNGPDAWALLEEMKHIDLGSGRARRRGY